MESVCIFCPKKNSGPLNNICVNCCRHRDQHPDNTNNTRMEKKADILFLDRVSKPPSRKESKYEKEGLSVRRMNLGPKVVVIDFDCNFLILRLFFYYVDDRYTDDSTRGYI